MTALVVKTKENDVCVPVVLSAHHIGQHHTAEGILKGLEAIIDQGGK